MRAGGQKAEGRRQRAEGGGLLALAVVATLTVAGGPAWASGTLCSPRDAMLRSLLENFGERPVAIGLTSGGNVYEVVASEHGESWTLLVTTVRGMSCMVASGRAWLATTRKIEGEDS